MKIYVGNLSYSTTEEELRKAFANYGEVTSAEIIKDKFSNQSKGFGFVEMPDDTQAKEAISALNETEMNERTIKVNEARPREERGSRGGGRGDFRKSGGGGSGSRRFGQKRGGSSGSGGGGGGRRPGGGGGGWR